MAQMTPDRAVENAYFKLVARGVTIVLIPIVLFMLQKVIHDIDRIIEKQQIVQQTLVGMAKTDEYYDRRIKRLEQYTDLYMREINP